MTKIYAVATPKGRLCPACAEKKFGEDLDNLPDENTVVLDSDDWKSQVNGPCDEISECGTFIGEG